MNSHRRDFLLSAGKLLILTGSAAAGGIALINSVGAFGAFVAPTVMGWLKDTTHNYQLGILILAGVLLAAAYVAYRLPPDPAQLSLKAQRNSAPEGEVRLQPVSPR